jgi:hypothetical protein
MSRIYCPDCGTQVSTETVTCPKCGFPIAEELKRTHDLEASAPEPRTSRRSNLFWLAFAAIGLLVVAYVWRASQVSEAGNQQEQSPSISTTTATLEELEAAAFAKCFPGDDPPPSGHYRCPSEARAFFRCILEKDGCYGECTKLEQEMLLCRRCRTAEEEGRKERLSEEQCAPYWSSP